MHNTESVSETSIFAYPPEVRDIINKIVPSFDIGYFCSRFNSKHFPYIILILKTTLREISNYLELVCPRLS